jgi:hypothetical protein
VTASSGEGCPLNAHIAQQVEHFLGKEEVTGSNPVVGTSNRFRYSLLTYIVRENIHVKGKI